MSPSRATDVGLAAVGGAIEATADVVLAAKSTTETPGSHEMSERFSALSVGSKFMCGEAALENFITEIMTPYGIKFLVKPLGANKNKDESTKELFPHRRFFWACGSCDMQIREMDDAEEGCCGFKIRLLLKDNKDDGEETHLEVREFKLPVTSNHRLVSTDLRQVAQSNTITNEKELTPTKINFIHDLGKIRARAQFARNLLFDQHRVKLSKNLLHAVMRRGRDMAWGANERESMCIFYAEGLNLRKVCNKLGVCGKFATFTSNDTGMLLGW